MDQTRRRRQDDDAATNPAWRAVQLRTDSDIEDRGLYRRRVTLARPEADLPYRIAIKKPRLCGRKRRLA